MRVNQGLCPSCRDHAPHAVPPYRRTEMIETACLDPAWPRGVFDGLICVREIRAAQKSPIQKLTRGGFKSLL